MMGCHRLAEEGMRLEYGEMVRREIEEDVIRRIRKFTGYRKRIGSAVEIYHELGVSGDDAFELLDGLCKAHGTTFRGFQFAEYFPNETEALWLHIKARFGFRDSSRKSLTVDHLVSVVEQGAWFDVLPACP